MKHKKALKHSLTAFEVLGIVAIVAALIITVPPFARDTFEGIEAARNIQKIIERP